MFMLAQASIFLWLPIVVAMFSLMPPRTAVINSFVFAWLFLPPIGFNLPGIPDYSKMTATITAVTLAMLIHDQTKLFSIRPRWYDLPMVVWCFGPFVTANMNGLGSYEGCSAIMEQVISWGLAYLIGRIYLTDIDALRDLAKAIAIGGLLYVPLCLIEIRLSPILSGLVWGVTRWEGTRYGGYRPRVFLITGLELGLWMTNASLIAYVIWSSGTIKTLRNISFGTLLLALLATTILCKSTGAIVLLVTGVVTFWATKRFKKTWMIWFLIVVPPTYAFTRTTHIWTGMEVVDISIATVGEERAQSFRYRLEMEDQLSTKAMERPVWGWGRFNRFQITNSTGRVLTVPDGFWIITLGTTGIVCLVALNAMMLLPMILTMRRFPISSWSDPSVGPVVGLALVLTLTMVDFLSNAMLNPIYPLAIGGLMCQKPFQRSVGNYQGAAESLAVGSELVSLGRVAEAGQEFRQAIELAAVGDVDVEARRIQAEALDGLAQTLLATGRYPEAVETLHDALALRDWLTSQFPDADHFSDLAIAREGLSRALAESGRSAEAIEERRIALRIWEILEAQHPRNVEYRDRRVNTLNDLAWLLATDPDPILRDPAQALAMAEEAARLSPDHDALWNTLGVARYRAGDWAGAIEALERSALASPQGTGTAFDHYFLAMAWTQLQHDDQAREWLERGVAWAARHRPGHSTLERFRLEAESLAQGEHDGAILDIS